MAGAANEFIFVFFANVCEIFLTSGRILYHIHNSELLR
jgi:hypothetical protein